MWSAHNSVMSAFYLGFCPFARTQTSWSNFMLTFSLFVQSQAMSWSLYLLTLLHARASSLSEPLLTIGQGLMFSTFIRFQFKHAVQWTE